jgi:hypothetical protein
MYSGGGGHNYHVYTEYVNTGILRHRRQVFVTQIVSKESLLQVRVVGPVPMFRNSNPPAPLHEQNLAHADKFRD